MNKRNQNQIDKIGLIIYHLNKRRRENQRNEKAKKCSCSGNYVPQNTDLDKYFAEFFSEILKINHGPITISISDICEQELSFKKDTFINIIYKVYFINTISHVARRLLGRKKKSLKLPKMESGILSKKRKQDPPRNQNQGLTQGHSKVWAMKFNVSQAGLQNCYR